MRPARPQVSTFHVRAATRDDVGFLTDCARQAYSVYVAAIGREPAPMTFDFAARIGRDTIEVIEADGRLCGYMVWRLREDCLFLDSIAIADHARGQGLARAAFDHLERVARAAGRPAIELYTNVAMRPNLTLYPHLGFVRTGLRNEDGFERVYFRKELDPVR